MYILSCATIMCNTRADVHLIMCNTFADVHLIMHRRDYSPKNIFYFKNTICEDDYNLIRYL